MKDSGVELTTLDRKYSLFKGRKSAGRIPIDLAMKLIATNGPGVSSSGGRSNLGGAKLLVKYMCQICHFFDSFVKLIGPSLYDVGKRLDKVVLMESITKLDAVITEGYVSGLMGTTLTGLGFYKNVTEIELK